MPPTVPQHPPAADLTAFALGKLAPADADGVARHLDECPACRRVGPSAVPFLSSLRCDQPGLDWLNGRRAVMLRGS